MMTDIGGTSSPRGVLSGLLARGRRPAIVPGRMPDAQVLPPDEHVRQVVAEPVGLGPSQAPYLDVRAAVRRSTAASSQARGPSSSAGREMSNAAVARPRPAPASVDVEPRTATTATVPIQAPGPEPTVLRARSTGPDQPVQPVIPLPALARGLVGAAPTQTRDASEPVVRTGPPPLLARLTAPPVREQVEAPVAPVVRDGADPGATDGPAAAPAQQTDRGPAKAADPARPAPVVAPAPPVTIGEIHVHVAAPAEAAPDPLALLAPWANGLTARRAATP